MSFSSDIKAELAAIENEQLCCDVAQAYGMLECGRLFSTQGVSLQTENSQVAARYTSLIKCVCDVAVNTVFSPKSGLHTVTADASAASQIRSRFGHGKEVAVRLNRANLDCEQCAYAYLRGAFLVCGAITNPQVDYHLEFSVPYYNLSHDLMTLMGELGLLAKCVKRKGNYVIYFKESEQIEDCLTMMGAVSASLELMNIKMIKDIRNNANRVANCESANIDKTVAASLAQTEAMKRIESTVGIDALPQELRDLCRLRLENPEYSLRELGECLEPPISRSGV
ncbi:MAG: DNA-binding protein WhiA, partial [Clostridia bacterium]|nr:DNA-binding protein WhiA [Clostridia bacterium]